MPIGNPLQSSMGNALDKKNSAVEHDFELCDPKYSLADVVLCKETQIEINSLVSLKRHHSVVFEKMGFGLTHKSSNRFVVNFYGEPGTGKTITAHAIAREFNKKILTVDYSQVESKYVGDTPKNLKKIFDFAKETGCLIFFDEADAILSRRVTNMQSSTDTSVNQTRSVLLNILNDFDGDLIFATNFISNYDPAFMRRISKHVKFGLPDENVRKLILKKYVPQKLSGGIDFIRLGQISEGLSAADIENATLMAGFSAATEGRNLIFTEDIERQVFTIKESKQSNSAQHGVIKTRNVSESYVGQQLGDLN